MNCEPQCPVLKAIENSTIFYSDGLKVGSVAKIRCQFGHILRGNDITKCVESKKTYNDVENVLKPKKNIIRVGKWDADFGYCESKRISFKFCFRCFRNFRNA